MEGKNIASSRRVGQQCAMRRSTGQDYCAFCLRLTVDLFLESAPGCHAFASSDGTCTAVILSFQPEFVLEKSLLSGVAVGAPLCRLGWRAITIRVA